jgi:hypothetical protein
LVRRGVKEDKIKERKRGKERKRKGEYQEQL